jgi:hypothetical protein
MVIQMAMEVKGGEGEGIRCEGEKIWKTTRRVFCAAGGKSSKQKLRQFSLAPINPSRKWISLFAEARRVPERATCHFFLLHTLPVYSILLHSTLSETIACRAFHFRLDGASSFLTCSIYIGIVRSMSSTQISYAWLGSRGERAWSQAWTPYCAFQILCILMPTQVPKHPPHNVKSAYCLMEHALVSLIRDL